MQKKTKIKLLIKIELQKRMKIKIIISIKPFAYYTYAILVHRYQISVQFSHQEEFPFSQFYRQTFTSDICFDFTHKQLLEGKYYFNKNVFALKLEDKKKTFDQYQSCVSAFYILNTQAK